jgi:hypothetical protein
METARSPVPDEVLKNVHELYEMVSKLPVASSLSNVALRTYLSDPKVVPGAETLSICAEYVTWLYATLRKSEPEPEELNSVSSRGR